MIRALSFLDRMSLFGEKDEKVDWPLLTLAKRLDQGFGEGLLLPFVVTVLDARRYVSCIFVFIVVFTWFSCNVGHVSGLDVSVSLFVSSFSLFILVSIS